MPPPSNPKLRAPQTARVALFRLIDQQLRADAALRSAVKTFRSWQGEAGDRTEPSLQQAPWLRLSIAGGPVAPWAASTQLGTLAVRVELWVAGSCLDDLDNLWGLVERACYPADPAARLAFQARLRAAGAHTGQVRLQQPAFDPGPAGDDHLEGVAHLALDYRFDQNPAAPGL